jgi:hypothetical protein
MFQTQILAMFSSTANQAFAVEEPASCKANLRIMREVLPPPDQLRCADLIARRQDDTWTQVAGARRTE